MNIEEIQKEKNKNFHRVSDIQTGSGNINFRGGNFSTLGFNKAQKKKLETMITENGGKLCDSGEETIYLIYDPDEAKKDEFWRAATRRESAGKLYMMTAELFRYWTDKEYKLNRRKFSTQMQICMHYLMNTDDWKCDDFERISEVQKILISKPEKFLDELSKDEDDIELLTLYLNWGHSAEKGKWFSSVNPKKMSVRAGAAMVDDYLFSAKAWENAKPAKRQAIEDYFVYNVNDIVDHLYRLKRYKSITLYMDALMEYEKEWKKTGFSDGFYVYTLLNKLTDRAIDEKMLDATAVFLEYKEKHFDDAFIEACEENDLDIEFGIKSRPAVYYFRGKEITFGMFQKSREEGAVAEHLKWEIIKQERDRVLILCKEVIASVQYCAGFFDVTWETCLVRDWLIKEFFNKAFMKEEQERIITVTNKNPNNKNWKTLGGNDTEDKVFVLSNEEIEEYLPVKEDRIREATDFAKKNTAKVNLVDKCCWWTRTPGSSGNYASYVYTDGKLHDYGEMGFNGHGVCPALWLDISGKKKDE